jgi:sulfatase modifying factor 1
MAGNASEWCSDWFSATYYRKAPEKDPQGPETGTARVLRGASWKSPGKYLRASYRGSRPPVDRQATAGFRCLLKTLP